ncbi:MAG: pyroglutamyl-peptidase I [Thermoplasmata archaeon]|nr:pyroglutamyl-peptidase I [Thermoplasmata archaeon]
MNVLITGFEKFSTFKVNPSEMIARRLDGKTIGKSDIKGVVLPVIYEDALERLSLLLSEMRWDLVLSLGLNPNIGWIALERYAHNIKESEVPDERGVIASGEEVVSGGETVLISNLPLERIRDRLREEGIPARISYSAGAYLCNSVFYYVLYKILKYGGRGGFIHIPLNTEYVAREVKYYGKCHMPIDTLQKAVEIAIETTLQEGEERSV